jgi:hypothetical protein
MRVVMNLHVREPLASPLLGDEVGLVLVTTEGITGPDFVYGPDQDKAQLSVNFTVK